MISENFDLCLSLFGEAVSVYVVCPLVLNTSNSKPKMTLTVKKIFIQEKLILPLTFNQLLKKKDYA